MTYQELNSWAQVKCSRCAEVECICGDPAFEAWIEEELAEQRAEDHNPSRRSIDDCADAEWQGGE